MKTIYDKIVLAAVAMASAATFTGCIDEVFPTDAVSEDQLVRSERTDEAVLRGMSGFMTNFNSLERAANDELHYDWGYGSIMHIRDVMTQDQCIYSQYYDQYSSWENNRYLGPAYAAPSFVYIYMAKLEQTGNVAVKYFSAEGANPQYLGVAKAFRAFVYLDMARMWEFLPNDRFADASLVNLTVPLVTEATSEAQAKQNPRITRQAMFEFLEGELDEAENLLADYRRSDILLPDLSVVYGLKARLYMWMENYAEAKRYAALAKAGYEPLTRNEWLNTSTGFNTLENLSWMMGAKAVQENEVVQTGICNWTSFMASETWYGYAAASAFPSIDAGLYDRISDTDFRKLSFVAPEEAALSGQEPYVSEDFVGVIPPYASLKFRPGFGNPDDFTVGSSTAIPVMRVEEMWLIEAEAAAHQSYQQGKDLIEEFMAYRDENYECTAATQEELIDEILLQKRIELWGEGQVYFDVKRLDLSVIRGYQGTNFPTAARFNTQGRPAWMNLVFPRSEEQSNTLLVNNPDPSGEYAAWRP